MNASRRSDEVDRVEPGERLVHEQDLGVVQDRGDELDLLLVALGQLLRAAVGVIRDAEAGQPGGRLACRALGRDAVQRREVDELVEDRHPRVQPALLGEVAPRPPRQVGDVGWPSQRISPASARRIPRQIRIVVVLPAPFAPRKPKTSPRGDLEGQAVEGDGRAEPLGDVVDRKAHLRARIARHPPDRPRPMVPGADRVRAADLPAPPLDVRLFG